MVNQPEDDHTPPPLPPRVLRPPPVIFFESPVRYDSAIAARMLNDIAQASTELDPTSCLITLTPFENGSVQICHLVSKELPQPNVSNFLSKY